MTGNCINKPYKTGTWALVKDFTTLRWITTSSFMDGFQQMSCTYWIQSRSFIPYIEHLDIPLLMPGNACYREKTYGRLWKHNRCLAKDKNQCRVCKKTSTAPWRLKFKVGTVELRFNYSVQVDAMFIPRHLVLHMKGEATQFRAASFLQVQYTKEILSCIQRISSLFFLVRQTSWLSIKIQRKTQTKWDIQWKRTVFSWIEHPPEHLEQLELWRDITLH